MHSAGSATKEASRGPRRVSLSAEAVAQSRRDQRRSCVVAALVPGGADRPGVATAGPVSGACGGDLVAVELGLRPAFDVARYSPTVVVDDL
jgi:hypothetical protein